MPKNRYWRSLSINNYPASGTAEVKYGEHALAESGATGIKRIWRATFFSAAGLRAALMHESAFRQECALAIFMLPATFWVGNSVLEYLLLIAAVLIVLITELLNSAIEAVVDRIGSEVHPLSGRAKDMGSAAVLLALLLAAIVWGVLIWKNLWIAT